MNKKNLTARQAVEHLETYKSSGSSESGISHYSSDCSLADSVSSGSTSSGRKNFLDSDGPSPAQRPRQYTAPTLMWQSFCEINPAWEARAIKRNAVRKWLKLEDFVKFCSHFNLSHDKNTDILSSMLLQN